MEVPQSTFSIYFMVPSMCSTQFHVFGLICEPKEDSLESSGLAPSNELVRDSELCSAKHSWFALFTQSPSRLKTLMSLLGTGNPRRELRDKAQSKTKGSPSYSAIRRIHTHYMPSALLGA